MPRINSFAGKWGYSFDEESYYGSYETRELAVAAAVDESRGRFWVGRFRAPFNPSAGFTAEDVIEFIQNQDDYQLECAEDWPNATSTQMLDLTDRLRAVLDRWIEDYGLQPVHAVIENDTVSAYNSDGSCQQLHSLVADSDSDVNDSECPFCLKKSCECGQDEGDVYCSVCSEREGKSVYHSSPACLSE